MVKKKHGEGRESEISKLPFGPKEFVLLISLIESKKVSSRGAKEVIRALEERGGVARDIAREKNLIQESNRKVLKKFVEEAIKESPKAPAQFLVGQVMKKSGNRANPVIVQKLLLEMLDN